PDDERVVEQPTSLQIGQQTGPGVLHRRDESLVPGEIVGVRVVAALADLDERYPVLHQLAGEEAAAAEFAVAIQLAIGLPLAVDFENLAGVLQPAGTFV